MSNNMTAIHLDEKFDVCNAEAGGAPEILSVAFSGDPDDAFSFYGLVLGAIGIPGHPNLKFSSSTIQDLNEKAMRGEHAVSAISAAAYPLIHEKYFISSAGSSVARVSGPLLASKRFDRLSQLRGRKIATPGPLTSGNMLLRMVCPDVDVVYLPFNEIRQAILKDEIAAGVLIHEELLNYREVGLRKILCLGEAWRERTQLPLPVGLNVVRRDLGEPLARAIVDSLRESIRFGLDHAAEAFDYARGYSIALQEGIVKDFVAEFASQDTVCLDEPTRKALGQLLDMACDFQEIPRLDRVDIL